MRKIIYMLLLIFTILFFSGCSNTNNKGCTTLTESSTNNGTLYTSLCKEDGKRYFGLMNEDFEIVLGETYSSIDNGLDIYGVSAESFKFDSETKYFRVRYSLEDGTSKQGVVDRNGTIIFTSEVYSKVIISEDQKMIYEYDLNSSIYNIETETTTSVAYIIRHKYNEYYLAQIGSKWIVLDESFNQVFNEQYDNVYYVSDELIIYEMENYLYSNNRITDQTIELFSTEVYPDFGLLFDEHDLVQHILINPNSDVIFVNFNTGVHVNPSECSRPLDFPNNYIIMTCENDYKVFDREDMSYVSTIPIVNTDIIPYSDAYFLLLNLQTRIISPDNEVVFDSYLDSYEILYNGTLIEIYLNNEKVIMDLDTIETLFTTNIECKVKGSAFGNTLFFTDEACTVDNVKDDITIIRLINSKFRFDDLEIMYYTKDWIYLLDDGNTKIVDYDLNIISD